MIVILHIDVFYSFLLTLQLQEKIDLNKTFSRREGISNEEILTITSKVESQRKELLDFKKALTNID